MLVSSGLTALAQSSDKSTFVKERVKPFYVTLLPERTALDKLKLDSLASLEILDYRPDTLRFGFFGEKGMKPSEILLKNSSIPHLTLELNKALGKQEGTRHFLIVLRKLWISDIVVSPRASEPPANGEMSKISFRAEVYLKQDMHLVPLVAYDTLILSEKPTWTLASSNAPELLTHLFTKLQGLNIPALTASRRTISFEEMVAFSHRDFIYPADTVAAPAKGVYLSASEFQTNQPSITDFELERDDKSLTRVYVKDADGKPYLTRKYWGFYDGKEMLVMLNGGLYPLVRSGHSFYIYGVQILQMRNSKIIPYLIGPALAASGAVMDPVSLANPGNLIGTVPNPKGNSLVKKTSFFAIDLKTGELF